jgi:hypothetical protein
MKPFLKAAAFALLAAAVPASAVMLPLRIPFQGKLIDPVTNNPKNGTFTMCFGIYPAPSGGGPCASAPFTETQSVAVVNGVFTVQIGTVSLLNPDLFSGASAYLGVTVGADAEMSPRQPLSMSPYAFTAMQLVSDQQVRINSGVFYTTFTAVGDWQFPYGVTAGTGIYTATGSDFSLRASSGIYSSSGGITSNGGLGFIARFGVSAATGSFTATGADYSISTSSGIDINGGGLNVDGSLGVQALYGIVATTGNFTGTATTTASVRSSSGIFMSDGYLKVAPASKGIDATGTGIIVSTINMVGKTADPGNIDGMVYFNSSSGTFKVYSSTFGWQWLYALSPLTSARTTDSQAATAAKAAAGTILVTPITLSGPMVVNAMIMRVTTNLGATGDIGVYSSTGGLVLQAGSGLLTTPLALKTLAPAQTGVGRWLPPGQYYAAMTWNSTTGVAGGLAITTAGAVPNCGSVLGGGSVLPATINPAAITDLTFCYFFVLSN